MASSLVVIPGFGEFDLATLKNVAGDFGWIVHVVHDLHEIAELVANVNTVAVLINRDTADAAFSWPEIIHLLKGKLPNVRLVVCHGFGDAFDWTELSDAGAFHALQLPLQEHELRQSLGFIWEAERRLATPGPVRVTAAA